MKKNRIIKTKLISKALDFIDEPYEKWRTYNDKMNTILFIDNENANSPVELKNDELPLLECELNGSYVLISTDRVISILDGDLKEIYINEIQKFGNEFEKENFKPVTEEQPKTNLIALYDSKGNRLVFKIDSLYPAYFAKILIQNLVSYHKTGVF